MESMFQCWLCPDSNLCLQFLKREWFGVEESDEVEECCKKHNVSAVWLVLTGGVILAWYVRGSVCSLVIFVSCAWRSPLRTLLASGLGYPELLTEMVECDCSQESQSGSGQITEEMFWTTKYFKIVDKCKSILMVSLGVLQESLRHSTSAVSFISPFRHWSVDKAVYV